MVNNCSDTSIKQMRIETQLAFSIAMQFSHMVSLLFAAATRSGMKDVHLAGHSCFRTYYVGHNSEKVVVKCIY